MSISTNKLSDPSPLDQKAHAAATRIAEKHGLMNRARNVWHSMATELLSEIQPAIEDQARAESDQAAKARLREVLALPEAEGRRNLAESLALETDTPVDQCRAILKSSPQQTQHDPLATLMRGQSPGINSDIGDFDAMCEEDETEAAAQFILNAGSAK